MLKHTIIKFTEFELHNSEILAQEFEDLMNLHKSGPEYHFFRSKFDAQEEWSAKLRTDLVELYFRALKL